MVISRLRGLENEPRIGRSDLVLRRLDGMPRIVVLKGGHFLVAFVTFRVVVGLIGVFFEHQHHGVHLADVVVDVAHHHVVKHHRFRGLGDFPAFVQDLGGVLVQVSLSTEHCICGDHCV